MLKIVYFYQYFSTPKGSWGTRVYEFAKYWVEQGHEVTVITSVFAKSDLKANGFIDEQIIDGIRVKIINVKVNNKSSIFTRLYSFIKYGLVASYYALSLPADVVIASSGPLTVGIPGLISKYIKKRKFVFEVRDLWPDAIIELGGLKNKFAQNIAYKLERACYKAADLIVVLSPGMQDNIKQRFNLDKIISVTNSANIDLFSRPINSIKVPDYFSSHLIAIYTGNIGTTNNSELLYNAAKELMRQGNKQIKIVLVGDGKQKEFLKSKAKEEGVSNFIILDLMPKTELVALLQKSFVSLIPLASAPLLDTSSPNKLFESLAAGLPVVQTTQGWIKSFLTENSCGFTIDATDPVGLANLLIELSANRELISEYVENARIIAVQQFDKNILAKKMLDGVLSVLPNENLRTAYKF
ncbi:glycosyltransferase family 4 protein [Solitalea sp. MAHUQ-68]|uniref:Glycosyltransferase family 4 protein n=1 Tax=Solitalea agri TaxID=2953739 RepID=A0A9X2F2S2_9SPHI|nr:glycosyltransferase family 4 protein [Solitalea agri]MCO4293654.1 glycosyltransferase family 4 protein [Solitalea agri]